MKLKLLFFASIFSSFSYYNIAHYYFLFPLYFPFCSLFALSKIILRENFLAITVAYLCETKYETSFHNYYFLLPTNLASDQLYLF